MLSGFGTDSAHHVLKYGLDYPLIVHFHALAASGQTPEFLSVQLTDILAFGTLAGAGLLLRKTSSAHKRLMMLALIYISDARFARLLNAVVSAPLGDGFCGDMVALYLGSDLIVLALGAYDLITRRALHPAYVIGALWMVTLQLIGRAGLYSPGWKALSLHVIGH